MRAAILTVAGVALLAAAAAIHVPQRADAQLGLLAGKPTLVVFGGAGWCVPCDQWKDDVANNRSMMGVWIANVFSRQKNGKHYVFVNWDQAASRWSDPAIARECERATGQRLKSVPAFWIKGQSSLTFGYKR